MESENITVNANKEVVSASPAAEPGVEPGVEPVAETVPVPTLPEVANAHLMAELHQRCEELRQWHLGAGEEYARKQAELTRYTEHLGEERESLTAEASRLEAARAALADAKAELAAQRGSFAEEREAFEGVRVHVTIDREALETAQQAFAASCDATRQALAEEREAAQEETAEARAAVEADRRELARLRGEMDEEWTSVCRLRRANEKLSEELDAERQRMNKRSLKLADAISRAA